MGLVDVIAAALLRGRIRADQLAPLATGIIALPQRGVHDITWLMPHFATPPQVVEHVPQGIGAKRRLVAAARTGLVVVKLSDRLDPGPEGVGAFEAVAALARAAKAPLRVVALNGVERSRFARRPEVRGRAAFLPDLVAEVEPVALDRLPGGPARRRRVAGGRRLWQAMTQVYFRGTPVQGTIAHALAGAVGRFGAERVIVRDPVGGPMSAARLALGAAVLGRALARLTAPGERVGVLLPNTAGVAVTLLALLRHGRVPAMLNYTAGPSAVVAACRTAGVQRVVTSSAFVEKAGLQGLVTALTGAVEVTNLEEVRAGLTVIDKLLGALAAKLPVPSGDPDGEAVVLFTSGSEGTPKGVVLSHRNVLSNVAQIASLSDFGPGDVVFNPLPVFHSFGLTAGLCLPMLTGGSLVLYPSPLHYKEIPKEVRKSRATILFATDTFLNGYARTADPADFATLTTIIAGAEPVKATTRKLYRTKFGLEIMEGCGLTEAAPVIACNTRAMNRDGTIGPAAPGLRLRLEEVEGIEVGGRLHLAGPNVMKGYLLADRPGEIVAPPEGWHDTGDVVAIDDEGFLTIVGRLKRFAKIAGEMVSLAAAEAVAAEAYPDNRVAVVAVPDARKGERVVLLIDRADATRPALIAAARKLGANELTIPAEILAVDEVPVLGSGKTDHLTARKLALARLAA